MWLFRKKQAILKENNGFKDLIFRIITQEGSNPNFYLFDLEGEYKQKTVGLRLQLQKGMKPGIINGQMDNTAFRQNGLILLSMGAKSDNLLEAICELYGIQNTKKHFIKELSLTTFALDGNPQNLEHAFVKFKIFNDSSSEQSNYWEMYCNVDIPNKVVHLDEKDVEYRQPIIKSLSE